MLASGRNAFVLVAVNKLIGRGFCFRSSKTLVKRTYRDPQQWSWW